MSKFGIANMKANRFKLRIFPGEWFKLVDWLILAGGIAFSFAVSLAVAFQCSPIGEESLSIGLEPADNSSWSLG